MCQSERCFVWHELHGLCVIYGSSRQSARHYKGARIAVSHVEPVFLPCAPQITGCKVSPIDVRLVRTLLTRIPRLVHRQNERYLHRGARCLYDNRRNALRRGRSDCPVHYPNNRGECGDVQRAQVWVSPNSEISQWFLAEPIRDALTRCGAIIAAQHDRHARLRSLFRDCFCGHLSRDSMWNAVTHACDGRCPQAGSC